MRLINYCKNNKIAKIDFYIIASGFLVILTLILANYSDFDVKIQNHFFNFEQKKWLINAAEPIERWIFYQIPKILIGITIFLLIFCVFFAFKGKNRDFYKNRYRLLLVFLGLVFIPLTVGNIKKFTNIYCPNQLEIYGGKYPYVKIFDHYDKNFKQEKLGKCYPAGHPVTGFCLFILFFAFRSKALKILGLFSALILGSILSFYQIAKGAHFVSDCVLSMFLCFFVAAILARILSCRDSWDV